MQSKASQLLPLNLTAPGAFGLTAETSISGDINEWLFEANHAIFTEEGLVAPRRLLRAPSSHWNATPFASSDLVYACAAAGQYFLSIPDKIFHANGTDQTGLPNDGDAPSAWSGTKDWQCAYLNNKWYFFCEGEEAKVTTLSEFSGVPQAPEVGIIHAAFGRLWAASETSTTLYWSLLLDGKDWTSAGTGSLELSSYMTSGERITAIADFNNFLIVFTNRSILIFRDPFIVPVDSSGVATTSSAIDENAMSLKEQIQGTGCVGKHAWCSVGEELIFMSPNGLMSLSRIIQEGGSNPLGVVAPHVNSDLIRSFKATAGTGQNLTGIRLNFHPLLGFVSIETGTDLYGIYLLWINRPIGKGAYAVTRWGSSWENILSGDYSAHNFSCMANTGGWAGIGPGITTLVTIRNTLGTVTYRGLAHYGWMNEGIEEEQLEEDEFTFTIKSAWHNFGDNPAGPTTKIPKDLKIIYRTPYSPEPDYAGTGIDVNFKLRFDYSETAMTHSFTTPVLNGYSAFSPNLLYSPHTVTPVPLSGAGSLVQWEISAVINNLAHEAFAVQRAGIQSKLGRIHQGI